MCSDGGRTGMYISRIVSREATEIVGRLQRQVFSSGRKLEGGLEGHPHSASLSLLSHEGISPARRITLNSNGRNCRAKCQAFSHYLPFCRPLFFHSRSPSSNGRKLLAESISLEKYRSIILLAKKDRKIKRRI